MSRYACVSLILCKSVVSANRVARAKADEEGFGRKGQD